MIRIKPVDERPGRVIGRSKYQSSVQVFAPSIRPASRMLSGLP
jgi:hypothetical protein